MPFPGLANLPPFQQQSAATAQAGGASGSTVIAGNITGTNLAELIRVTNNPFNFGVTNTGGTVDAEEEVYSSPPHRGFQYSPTLIAAGIVVLGLVLFLVVRK
jgi:hypothetical protein